MILLLLVAIASVGAAFAAQNEGTQVFHLFHAAARLPTWAPTALGVGADSLLVALAVSSAALRSSLRQIRHERAIGSLRGEIDGLEEDNRRLREELAALTRRVPSGDRGGRRASASGAGARPRPEVALAGD